MKNKFNLFLVAVTLFSLFFSSVPVTLADGKYPVRITEQSIIVFPVDEQTMQAVQIVKFQNNGTEKEAELPLYLPEGYRELEVTEGIAPDALKEVGKGIVDTTGLEPGKEKQMIVTYLMPMEKDASRWIIEQSYVTESFQVVVPAGVLSFEAGNLVTQSELFEMNGREFRKFTRVDVHPSEPWVLSFRLLKSGAPKEETAGQEAAATEERVTSDGKRIFGHEHGAGYTKAVVTLIIVFLALTIALVGLRRDHRLQKYSNSEKPERPWLMTEKATILHQIGQLEQDNNSQLLSLETYESSRQQLRDRLIRIALEMRRDHR